MITLDGSTLEGGGQLVRVALALSAITSAPIRIENIRANRAPPHNRRSRSGRIEGGLKESHLAALLWLAKQTNARVDGAEVGSRVVVFRPKNPGRKMRAELLLQGEETKQYQIVLKKPGSVWLIFQAILPYIIFGMRESRVHLVFRGGTNVDKSMTREYVEQVLLPTLWKIGVPVDVSIEMMKRGWAGNAPEIGEVKVLIERRGEGGIQSALEGFAVQERGGIEKLVVSVVARPEAMRRKVTQRVAEVVKQRLNVPVEVAVDDDSEDERRFYILLVAHTTEGWRLGRDFLGGGGKMKDSTQLDRLIESSVKKIVNELEVEIKRGGCVDEHMQDQLVIFQALANGASVVDAGRGREDGTLHTRTVRWVCEQILDEAVKFSGGNCQSHLWDSRGQLDLAEKGGGGNARVGGLRGDSKES